jgi:hypothetical protein
MGSLALRLELVERALELVGQQAKKALGSGLAWPKPERRALRVQTAMSARLRPGAVVPGLDSDWPMQLAQKFVPAARRSFLAAAERPVEAEIGQSAEKSGPERVRLEPPVEAV